MIRDVTFQWAGLKGTTFLASSSPEPLDPHVLCLPYCLFSPPQTTLINLSRSREAKKADRNKSSDTYEGVIQQELHQVNRTCVEYSRKFIGMGCAGMMMRVSVWDGGTLHQRCPKSQLADAATVPLVFRICQIRTKWRLQGAKKKEFTRLVPHMSSFSYLCRGKSCEYGE